MKYPFFASFIVFCLTLMYTIHRLRDKEAEKYQSFWDKEAEANATRRKSLDDLNYITIPFESLPTEVMKDDPKVAEYLDTLKNISDSPIVNFTGYTNTELKLKYGAPNIDKLDAYDQAYTTLARTLNLWAYCLYESEYVSEAKTVLEFAMETKTDVSSSYDLLAKIYSEENNLEKIKELISKASEINSSLNGRIIENLKTYLPDENLLEDID